jgi:beta-lactamase superfamily II metal-dependent hydrolase
LNQAPARASILYCDHAGGLAPILRTLSVGVILDSGQVYVGHAYNDGMDEARRHRVPVEVARYGDQLSFDENRVAILSPCTRATGGKTMWTRILSSFIHRNKSAAAAEGKSPSTS